MTLTLPEAPPVAPANLPVPPVITVAKWETLGGPNGAPAEEQLSPAQQRVPWKFWLIVLPSL
jgi:hypothetical protein